MADVLRRWWWIPAGYLVALVIGRAIGPWWVVALLLVYATLNLAGTGMLLSDLDDESRSRWWRLFVEVAFVVQLPLGAAVVVMGGA